MKTRLTRHNGTDYLYWRCQGCKTEHGVPVNDTSGQRPRWDWNGDRDKPTLSPSVHVHPIHDVDDEDGTVFETPRCHVFIVDGQIQFLSDCTHAFAGQTVDMVDVEEHR